MSAEDNKAIVRRVFTEIWNNGNLALVDELVAADYVNHNPVRADHSRGPAEYRETVRRSREAFPDWNETIDDLLADGDKVVVRFTLHGTQRGEVMGPAGTIAPTGRTIAAPGMVVYRLAGGKLVERWGVSDALGIFQQLGALPAPAQAGR